MIQVNVYIILQIACTLIHLEFESHKVRKYLSCNYIFDNIVHLFDGLWYCIIYMYSCKLRIEFYLSKVVYFRLFSFLLLLLRVYQLWMNWWWLNPSFSHILRIPLIGRRKFHNSLLTQVRYTRHTLFVPRLIVMKISQIRIPWKTRIPLEDNIFFLVPNRFLLRISETLASTLPSPIATTRSIKVILLQLQKLNFLSKK
jgi:hypothetical protein